MAHTVRLDPEPGVAGLWFVEMNTHNATPTHAVQATDGGYAIFRLPEDVHGSEPFAYTPTLRLARAVVKEDLHRKVTVDDLDIEAATRRTKRIFRHDVEWAQHPDPMTDEDWEGVTRKIVDAALGATDA